MPFAGGPLANVVGDFRLDLWHIEYYNLFIRQVFEKVNIIGFQ